MADDEPSGATPVNLTRAFVTGKIPNAKGASQGKGVRAQHSPRERKTTARRLKRKGLISDKAAKRHGL